MTIKSIATASGWKRVSLPALQAGGTQGPPATQQDYRNSLQMNTYFPDESNTGVLSDVTRTSVSSLALVPGQTYSNLDINAVLLPPAANGSLAVVFRNCWFRGTAAVPTTATGLIRAYNNLHAPLEFYDCLFQPQTPHFYWIGLQGYGFKVVRSTFRYLVDGIEGFNNNTGHTNDPSSVKIYQSWFGKHAYYKNPPDITHTDGSHSDGIQIEGNTGYDIQGNTFTGLIGSQFAPNYYGDNTANAAFMIKPDVSIISGLNVQHNYIGGGAASVNIANDPPDRTLSNIGIIANNSFGRDQRLQGSGGDNTYTVLMPSNVTGTFTGNVYADTGSAITVRHNG